MKYWTMSPSRMFRNDIKQKFEPTATYDLRLSTYDLFVYITKIPVALPIPEKTGSNRK